MFQAWIEPEALEHWFRPLGMSVTVSKLEARVGGLFRFDGEDGNSTVGTYLHIVPPEKLVFTWSGAVTQGRETVVTLDFLDRGSETEIVLTHERLSTPEMHEMFEVGWQSLFDALASALSTHLDF
ncbi:MAG: SRPBCC domain-containing protein [Chloroflexota bacterium]|nr:SRPBCC domain-containing protein [Chloroflexota bacterium]